MTYIVKFDKDGSAKFAAVNEPSGNEYKEETSLWEIITDYGPVLTFNSYNSLFHFYADPNPDGTSSSDGKGHEGDYEFVLMKRSDNLVTLMGKKHKYTAYLHRLPENMMWEEYYQNLNTNKAAMFSSRIPTLWLTAGNGERYSITNHSNLIFNFVPEGGDPISETTPVAAMITPNGFRFVYPFTGDNNKFSVQDFEFTEDGQYLVANDEDGTIATIKAPVPALLFSEIGTKWRIDKNTFGGKYADAYEQVVNGFKASYPTLTFQYFQFQYNASTNSYAMLVRVGSSNGLLYLNMTPTSDNNIKLTFNGESDRNCTTFLTRVPALKAFCDVLQESEFVITATSEICPTKMSMNAINVATDKFDVNAQ